VGTGFLVGDGLLMTNRHVASVFAVKAGASWKFTSGVSAQVDYKEEYQRDLSREFKVTDILGIHQTYDMALLKVAMKSKGKKAPAPLPIASSKPKATKDGDVVVVGYPAYDSRNGHAEMLEIFSNIFNVKRLQPGKSTGLTSQGKQSILGHDASTLGGNSGSCVVDLESGKVIGLHFGGQYLVGNVSVPLWAMTKDAMLKKQKINWQ
jgi:S1-C subfamily serine protease